MTTTEASLTPRELEGFQRMEYYELEALKYRSMARGFTTKAEALWDAICEEAGGLEEGEERLGVFNDMEMLE